MNHRHSYKTLFLLFFIVTLTSQQLTRCVGGAANGILQGSQQCDQGASDTKGCGFDCIIDVGYRCSRAIGQKSGCATLCGDFVKAGDQQCDNGNQPGCLNCILDPTYNCVPFGSGTLCSKCGNSIVQNNEECDNGNNAGCVNCKKAAGYICLGTAPSFCYIPGKTCGNGFVQVGESCDDGNNVNGDGCNANCLAQIGWACKSTMGTLSVCRKIGGVCGNGIFEPLTQSITDNYNLYGFNAYDPPGNYYDPSKGQYGWNSYQKGEFCDNGNKEGCLNCFIQPGYNCKNQIGKTSVCSLAIVVPTCGNGVLQTNLKQQCDDGNVNNNDGCNYMCRVQPGWLCQNNKCLPLQLLGPTVSCGNGRLQSILGQQCDDANKNNGDGCSDRCQFQKGFICPPNEGAKSACYSITNTFCGNGIVEGLQQCDNGWPIGIGGCNIHCKIIPGWSCYVIKYQGPSLCYPMRTPQNP